MPKMSRDKGKRGEREVINQLQEILDRVRTRRGLPRMLLERNLLQAHLGGCDMFGLEWLALEVKRQEYISVEPWWRQTVEQAGPKQTPVLVWRASHQPWRVRLRGVIQIFEAASMPVVMDVSWEWFLQYFEQRLEAELGHG